MLAYDWMLALVAFAVAAPLAFVLRAVQRHLVAGLRRWPASATPRCSPRSPRWSPAPRRCAPTAPARRTPGDQAEAIDQRSRRRPDPGRRRSARSCSPRARCSRVLTVAAVVVVGVGRGPDGGLTAGAMVGFIFLTYRFLEPIAEFTEVLDQTQTAVAGLRRVLGVLDIPIGPPPTELAACRCRPARSTSTSTTSRSPTDTRRHRRRRRAAGAARRRRAHPRRPAGRRRRRHRFGQDDARSPRSPASPIRPSAQVRLGGVPLHVRRQRRAARSGSSSCRRSRSCSTTRSPPTSASPGPVRRSPTSRRGRRPARPRRLARHAARRPDDARSASAASSCRPASASSSPCCAPASPIPTCWCSTRRRRRSTRSPRCASRARSDASGRGPHHDRHRPPPVDRGPRRPRAGARRRAAGRGRHTTPSWSTRAAPTPGCTTRGCWRPPSREQVGRSGHPHSRYRGRAQGVSATAPVWGVSDGCCEVAEVGGGAGVDGGGEGGGACGCGGVGGDLGIHVAASDQRGGCGRVTYTYSASRFVEARRTRRDPCRYRAW